MLPFGRALAAGVLGGLLGALLLALSYGINPALRIEFDTTPPRLLVSGVYPSERDRATGLTFAWTQQDMAVRVPGLDRSVDWHMDVRVRAARPDPADNPDLAFYADGVRLMTRAAATDFEEIRVTVPARPDRRRRALISMQSSSTVVPGPHDSRALGVLVDSIVLTPAGFVLPPPGAFTGAAGAGAALGAAVALTGVTGAGAVGAVVLVSAGAALQIARGFGPYTDYPATAATAALWIGLLLVIGARATERVRGEALRSSARFVAAFSAGALLFKLLVVLHPNMPIGDAMFHAHRFHDVLAGNLYFTSVAPGNYLFPYAPGLYVFSAPFAGLVTRGAADMALLRIIVLSVDAVAALALYVIVVRRWKDRTAGAIAVALYHVIPLEFRVVTVGNLTNVFAQSLSVIALGMMASSRIRFDRPAFTAGLVLVLAAAFMSHTSTFPLLFLSAVLTALLFLLRGGPDTRGSARVLLLGASAACILAVGLFYAHFGETYRSELARISGETASAAPDAGGRGIGARLATVPYYLQVYFGWPAMLLAAAGAWHLRQRGARDRLTLATAGWALVCLIFLGVGILTPVDMRYYLAAIPALALAGGYGASCLWAARGVRRGMAVLLMAWALGVGSMSWWRVF